MMETEEEQKECDLKNQEEKIEDAKMKLEEGVEKTEDGCWLWKGHVHACGYGMSSFRSRSCYSHILAWMLWCNNGEKPKDGQLIRHNCIKRHCCHWRHLTPGTPEDNARDRDRDGTMIRGEAHHWHRVNRIR